MSHDRGKSVGAARRALGIGAIDALDDGTDTALPTIDQAAWNLLEVHLGDIARGRLEPEQGMQLVIEEVFRPAGLAKRSRHRVGDSHGIETLVGLQDEYDDMRRYERRTGTRDRRRSLVDAQVIAASREWMAHYSSEREL